MLFNAGQILAVPLLFWKKWRRFKARGDAYEWDLARWNAPKFDAGLDNGQVHLVLVAMGFAETRLAARLTALLGEQRPDLRVTWAIRNADAAREGGAIPANQPVVPLPFDFFWPVRRWIRALKPDAVIFIERFAFPNLARGLHNRGARVGAVAARTRDAKKNGFYGRWLLGAFDGIALRSEAERAKFGALGSDAAKFQVTGTLKFWPELPPLPDAQKQELKDWLQNENDARPILAAGSTQPGDEAWILEAFGPLRKKFGARLLLAPRHVARADEVEALARNHGFSVSRRSNEKGNCAADVLLLDTLGELAHAYGAARAAFVGGTISGTGHNVLEPIAHGIPVFFGPKPGTFAAEQEMCLDAGVGFRVTAPDELRRGWQNVLENEARRAEIAENAAKLNAQGELAWRATVAAILQILPAPRAESRANRSQ